MTRPKTIWRISPQTRASDLMTRTEATHLAFWRRTSMNVLLSASMALCSAVLSIKKKTSVVFRWLRNEISGKPISHKEPGAWVPVCGDRQGHEVLKWQLFFLFHVFGWHSSQWLYMCRMFLFEKTAKLNVLTGRRHWAAGGRGRSVSWAVFVQDCL